MKIKKVLIRSLARLILRDRTAPKGANKNLLSCIYQIRNLQTGDIYIGSSIRGIKVRRYRHLRDLRLNKHHSIILQQSFNKRGETAFIFEIVEYVEDVNKIFEREQYYIDNWQPKYNIARIAGSSMSGRKHSSQTITKLKALRRSDETKEKIRKTSTGRRHTEEAKAKVSRAQKGRVRTEEQILQISLSKAGLPDDVIIEMRWLYHMENVTSAALAERFDVSPTRVYNIVMGKLYKRIPFQHEMRRSS